MGNGLIDLTETGPCRVCKNPGTRAGGARDIERLALATGVFETTTFYCEECRAAAAVRSFANYPSTLQRLRSRQERGQMVATFPGGRRVYGGESD